VPERDDSDEVMVMGGRKYLFSWDMIGDIGLGRPNLGPLMRLETYRLMEFTFRDVIERRHGTEEADRIFHEAGLLAGKEFFDHVLQGASDFPEFVRKTQKALAELSIGILRIEKADLAAGSLVLTVSEDLDCSGLPDIGDQICTYDEGFLAGLLGAFTGKTFRVKEVDCWCTGGRTCRFTADVVA
jgi:predicted hydrocarbon binding protein